MQTQTQEILSWFGPFDLHPVPKQPAWDFPYPWFYTPKTNTCTPLDKSFLPNVYNSSYTKKITTSCTTSLLQSFSLSNYNQSYKPWICMWSWTRTLIGGLSNIFIRELVFEWRIESWNSVLKNRILNRVFGHKTINMN